MRTKLYLYAYSRVCFVLHRWAEEHGLVIRGPETVANTDNNDSDTSSSSSCDTLFTPLPFLQAVAARIELTLHSNKVSLNHLRLSNLHHLVYVQSLYD
jgi:hypothetical protein